MSPKEVAPTPTRHHVIHWLRGSCRESSHVAGSQDEKGMPRTASNLKMTIAAGTLHGMSPSNGQLLALS